MAKPKVIDINPSFNKKQGLAFNYLLNAYDSDICYGGGAGSGKSWLGCAWLIVSCIRYPGTRWLMGRSKLKSLQETTLVTFFDTCSSWGLEAGEHYTYNAKSNVISFGKQYGGSIILLKDLFAFPSDPEFESLGSLEITGAFCDEASQITSKAKEIVRSRIRYKLDNFCHACADVRTDEEITIVVIDGIPKKQWTCRKCGIITHGLAPKILMTCNPTKGWIYQEFYKPWKDDTLPKKKKFIPALVHDNPFIQSTYIENLQGLTGTNRDRLLNGNWEYDDDDYGLIEYDAIMDLFVNDVPPGERVMTVDIARLGKAKTVAGAWCGLRLEKIYTLDKNLIPEAVALIRDVQRRHGIHLHNVYLDQDGVGGGVMDYLDGCNGIVNNSPPIYVSGERENFGNLKSQLGYYLAEYINKRLIWIVADENQDRIIKELEWLRRYNADHDGKYYTLPKHEIIEGLGFSPDFLDMLTFRMLPVLNDGSLYL